uniref:NXPE family member 3-like n=1 Tax=Ciona intestinalis TaxID=7719 RepID=UPI00089DACE9|nr:NXPE family member 3-like [Ciona intestinalis]|eukprot:XP_004226701.2 NXPE family member 3-like [Ciona intestinalis]
MLRVRNTRRLYAVVIIFSLFVLLLYWEQIEFKLKRYMHPWEISVDGDLTTCEYMTKLLVKAPTYRTDELEWKTPEFLELLTGLRNPSRVEVRNKLCSFYRHGSPNYHKYPTSLKLVQNGNTLFSAEHSFYLIEERDYKVNDIIKVRIEARDNFGTSAAKGGGDFFKVKAYHPQTRSSISASQTISYGNGSYDAEILAFRSGPLTVQVMLGNSGHFIDAVKHLTSEPHTHAMDFYATFVNEATSDKTQCRIQADAFISGVVCNLTNRNGETWFCVKPKPGLGCSDLTDMYTVRRKNALDLFKMFPPEDRSTTKRAYLSGNVGNIFVSPDGDQTSIDRSNLPNCRQGIQQASPFGFWMNNEWLSTSCNNKHFSRQPKLAAKCITNRIFYFLGDSTIRQWFEYFLRKSHEQNYWTEKSSSFIQAYEQGSFRDVWDSRSSRIERTNTTFYYRVHGPPMQNGAAASSMRYISNELDQMLKRSDGGRSLTVVVGIGPHFLQYNPLVFRKRLTIIITAAEKMLARNPEATVIVKGLGTFDRGLGIGECCLTDWLSYRLNKITQQVLQNSKVIYMDVWHMTLSHHSPDLIHPVDEVISNQVDLALSYSCRG